MKRHLFRTLTYAILHFCSLIHQLNPCRDDNPFLSAPRMRWSVRLFLAARLLRPAQV